MKIRRPLLYAAAGAFGMFLFSAPAYAGTCVQSESAADGDQHIQYIFSNECENRIEVQVISSSGKVCQVMNIGPGRVRTFRQRKVCTWIGDATQGCVCERSVKVRERGTPD